MQSQRFPKNAKTRAHKAAVFPKAKCRNFRRSLHKTKVREALWLLRMCRDTDVAGNAVRPRRAFHKTKAHDALWLLCMWKRIPINVNQLLRRYVRITLRRGNAGMPEHFLHHADIRSVSQHRRGKRVPERVW